MVTVMVIGVREIIMVIVVREIIMVIGVREMALPHLTVHLPQLPIVHLQVVQGHRVHLHQLLIVHLEELLRHHVLQTLALLLLPQ